jgi:hypothetical protein
MTMATRTSAVLSMLILTACSHAPQPGHELGATNPTSEMTLLGASSRIVIRNADGSLCVGPPPDAAFSDSKSNDLGVTLVNVDNSETNDSVSNAHARLPLGGRNPNVLVTRDLLFEACLFSQRANLSQEQQLKLYRETLYTIQKVNNGSLDGAAVTTDTPNDSISTTSASSSNSTDSNY